MQKPRTKAVGISAVLHTYWQYLRQRPWTLGLIFGSSLVLQITNLVAPLYMRTLFNLLAGGTPDTIPLSVLLHLLVLISVVWIIDWMAVRSQTFTTAAMEARIMTELQTDAFAYLLEHSHTFFISNFSGSLTHKVKQFARSFEGLFDAISFQFLPTCMFMLGAIGILFVRNYILGLLLAVWTVLFVSFQIWIAKSRQPTRIMKAATDTRVTGTLADAISNQSAIALFAAHTYELARFKVTIREWHDATRKLWKMEDWTWAWLGLFMLVIQIAMLYGTLVLWKQGSLTIGDFVLVQSYLLTAFNRLFGVNRDLRGFYGAIADASEMIEILRTPHEIIDASKARPLHVTKGDVTFVDTSFAFTPTKPILQHLTLSIPGGQRVALVGPSGAGKSTITRLLLRMFDVKGGSIEIDGQNIAAVTQDSLREAIAFVPQEPVLFHRSLMDNIRYGRRDATDEEVLEAAKQAHCHEFISGLAEGYETFVGERGVKLSGGERQRVAIARALLKNAPILILDEATSSLDSESEHLIQDALAILMQHKTVLVIAHRLSTIMKMDRIIVLEGGSVVADGTHDELLAQGGLYQKLWSIQAGGFIPDEDAETNEEDMVGDRE